MGINSEAVNQRPVDIFTAAHAGWGGLLQALGLSLPQAVALSLLWEHIVEPDLKRRHPAIFPYPSQDTGINSALDTAAIAAGWCAAKYARTSRRTKLGAAGAAILFPVLLEPQILRVFTPWPYRPEAEG